MSFETVHAWVNHMLAPGEPREGIVRLFKQASSEGVEATVLAGSELTSTKRAYLVRWTGAELVVIELSPQQQLSFGLIPHACFTQLEARVFPAELPARQSIALSNIRLDSGATYDGWQPLIGACSYGIDDGESCSLQSCALSIQYFRPNLPRPVTGYWYASSSVPARQGDLQFKFNPLFSKKNPQTFGGTLVLFLQFIAAQDWRRQTGLRRVSNVASAVVEIQ